MHNIKINNISILKKLNTHKMSKRDQGNVKKQSEDSKGHTKAGQRATRTKTQETKHRQ